MVTQNGRAGPRTSPVRLLLGKMLMGKLVDRSPEQSPWQGVRKLQF